MAVLVAQAQGGGGGPVDAQYVVMALNATLTQERVLTAGTGLTLTDGGAGGNATLDVNATVIGASYVVMGLSGTLTDERVLTGTANRITVTDGGAGGNVTLNTGALVPLTNVANTFTVGPQTIQTGGGANVGLILELDAAQATDAFQIQDSIGGVLSGADERGILFSDGGTDTSNTFIGADAGNATTTGTSNVGIGSSALEDLTSGVGNFGLGTNAGRNLQNGQLNVALGISALDRNVSGSQNMAIGYRALYYATQSSNVAVGNDALRYLQTGQYNVAIGRASALGAFGVSAFSGNVCIGYSAGAALTTGATNVLLGYLAGSTLTNQSNLLYIANSATTTPLLYGEFDGGGGYGVRIHGPATGAVTFTVREIAGQTANAQNWETSAGVALMEVEAGGVIDYRWAMGNSTKDPRAVLPDDWVEIKIGGTSYYLPAYLV